MKKLSVVAAAASGLALTTLLAFSQRTALLISAVSQPENNTKLANAQAWTALKVLHADPEGMDDLLGMRLIDTAAVKGQTTVVKYFLEAGARPDDGSCSTLKFGATKSEIVNLLLDAGTNPGNPECAEALYSTAINRESYRGYSTSEGLKRLLQAAQYAQKDLDRALAMSAIFNLSTESDEVMTVLINAGANPNKALQEASGYLSPDAIRKLLARGADPQANNGTALKTAEKSLTEVLNHGNSTDIAHATEVLALVKQGRLEKLAVPAARP